MRRAINANSQRVPLVCAAIMAVHTALFFPTYWSLHAKWTQWTTTYSHGYLVVAITAWLVLRAAARMPGFRPASPVVVVALTIASASWFVAWVAGVFLVQAVLLPVLLYLMLVAAIGPAAARGLAFPAAYLYFAVPFWDAFAPVLQWLTIKANSIVLNLAGVTAYIEGSFVYLPAGTFEIAHGCSGLHFFIVSLALSTLYAHLFLDRARHKALLVGASAIASIVMNWLRVASIVLAGNATDMQHYLVTVDHYNYGWILFAVMLVPLYWLATRLELREVASDSAAYDRVRDPAMAQRPVFAPALLAAIVGPVAAVVIAMSDPAGEDVGMTAPEAIGEWERVRTGDSFLDVRFPGSIASIEAEYVRSGVPGTLGLFANHYGRPKQGAELINSENRLFDGATWRVIREQVKSIPTGEGEAEMQVVQLLSTSGRQRLLAFWYVVDGHVYTKEKDVKFAEVAATLRRRPGSGIRVLAFDCGADCTAAGDTFVETLVSSPSTMERALLREPMLAGTEP